MISVKGCLLLSSFIKLAYYLLCSEVYLANMLSKSSIHNKIKVPFSLSDSSSFFDLNFSA